MEAAGSDEIQEKKDKAKLLFKQYVAQLTKGCGREYCLNASCVSSGQASPLTMQEAAKRALQIIKTASGSAN